MARTIACNTRALRRRRSRAWHACVAFALGVLFGWLAERALSSALPLVGASSLGAGLSILAFVRAGTRADRVARRVRALRDRKS